MKIAIYGGAFDPIGKHHLSIANQIISLNIVDEVWIMPCYQSMKNKQMVSAFHRLEMCQIAITSNNNNKIKLCDFEIRNKFTLSSLEITRLFLEYYQKENYQFYFLMGADNAISVNSWPNYQSSLQLIPFIIVPRRGYELSPNLWCFMEPHLVINNISYQDNSSTQIRSELKSNKQSDLLFQKVNLYIKNNNLY